MILVQIQQLSTSKILIQSAGKLAVQLGKSFAVLTVEGIESELKSLLNECKIIDLSLIHI